MKMLDQATLARIPRHGLPSLSKLRREDGIWVIPDGEHAWISWAAGDDRVLRVILPIEGAELYELRGNAWHRAGRRLPSPVGPPDDEPIPLAKAIFPGSFSIVPPNREETPNFPLTLRRDDRPRPTSAMYCRVSQLGQWAETAPSFAFAAVSGAIRGDHALLLGQVLPNVEGAIRYWGGQLLVPIGFEVRPLLPEATLIEALGRPGRELLRVIPEDAGDDASGFAVEAIPTEVLRPLSRAGIRLAMVGATPP